MPFERNLWKLFEKTKLTRNSSFWWKIRKEDIKSNHIVIIKSNTDEFLTCLNNVKYVLCDVTERKDDEKHLNHID